MAAAMELRKLTTRKKRDEEQLFRENIQSDCESEEVDHDDLLKKIKSLNKKELSRRRKGPLRSELNENVSEFYLKSDGDNGHINLDDLVGSLQTSSYHSKLKKSLECLHKMGHTVDVPLAKPAADRVRRIVAYEETSKDISKWDATVKKNRQAEQLQFPLDAYKPAEMSTTTLVTTFKPCTPLEQEIANVLQNSSQVLEREDKELSLEEEEALKNMSLEEALERRHELQKLRALQSYYEQKCRRMKKIKSKKYHRIKRRAEKRANSKKTFQELQKENPELAQAELEKAEKLRVQERMSLKHRNTSKWAKNIISKGINDVQARQALTEQLRISRQLTDTKTVESDSDEDEDNKIEKKSKITENFRNFGLVGDNSENPWLLDGGKEKEDAIEERTESRNIKERLRKLEAVTAEETKEGERGEVKNDGILDDSREDEIFELMDESGVQESGKEKEKGRKNKCIEKNESERKQGKRKKVKKKKKLDGEAIILKGKQKGKKKKMISKGNIEESIDGNQNEGVEVTDVEEERMKREEMKYKVEKKNNSVSERNMEHDDGVEMTVGRKKRKITEENEREEKSKKTKKAKLLHHRIQGEIQEETEQYGTLVDDEEKLLIERVVIEDHEHSQIEKLDAEITAASETQATLNPKNVFQIEDLGEESDFLNHNSDDSRDEMHSQRMTIQEAFANDDVIEEFVKEKADKTEASKPKDLDLSLPGWGDWGGPGIDETKRRKKFTVLAKPTPPRKDTKLAHVIINEERDKKFAKNQVSQLPFPFASHDQWERSVRVPLGKDWNTASVHQKLVKHRIITLPGTIIEPIKPAKGVRRHGRNKGARIMGTGIEIHN